MKDSDRYYLRLAAAFVRGKADQGIPVELTDALLTQPLDTLSEAELENVFRCGLDAGCGCTRSSGRSTCPACGAFSAS